jgi:hypothetical protein
MFGYQYSQSKKLGHRGVIDQGLKSYELIHNRLENRSELTSEQLELFKSKARVACDVADALSRYNKATQACTDSKFDRTRSDEKREMRNRRDDLRHDHEVAKARAADRQLVGEKVVKFIRENLADEAQSRRENSNYTYVISYSSPYPIIPQSYQ